jgi:uncharacterized alpha-E superfamily protein
MLSRVANSVYWMSRYIERAENVARMIGVNLQLAIDLPGLTQEQWAPMVNVTGNDDDFRKRHGEASRESVLQFLTFDGQNPDSIVSCVRAARQNARTVREIISSEMWEEINRLYLLTHRPMARDEAARAPHEFYLEVKRRSHLIEGTKNETMPHSEAWHFTRLGRFLERADQTTRILDVKYFLLLPSVKDVGNPVDDLQWSAVLRSISAFEPYRKIHGQVRLPRIIEFLLLDREFPRAVHYCLSGAQASLHAITGTPVRQFQNDAERRLGRLCADLDYTRVEEVIRVGLHEFVDTLQARISDVGSAVQQDFFAMPPRPLRMASLGQPPASAVQSQGQSSTAAVTRTTQSQSPSP